VENDQRSEVKIAHNPVLLKEVIEALAPDRGGIFIDATFGRGGHSRALLDLLTPVDRLIALDQDEEAICHGEAHFKDPRFLLIHRSFRHLQQVCEQEQCTGQVRGILMDLGVSSPQLDTAERGFSFMRDGPLDMRMDTSQGLTASELIQSWTERELVECLFRYGEEKYARRIAKKMKEVSAQAPIQSTHQLADIIASCYPRQYQRIHPATRSFQAIRIAVNDELGALKDALTQAFSVLAPGGRLAVISFHSLEDRITKHFMQDLMKDPYPKEMPIKACDIQQKCRWIAKIVRASPEEIESNPRSRSAVLRVIEKC
jgi:16S rRNA (cytosine1402-N4)-methyltransferase